jgi:hypothetical protein
MNIKLVLGLALVLGGSVFSATTAKGQPGGGSIYHSLEARIVEARVVFRGTITNVSDLVIHTNNQFSREGVFTNQPVENYDIHNYTFTLTVDEVLKGDLPRKPLEFIVNHVAKWGELEKSAEERASFLWFVKDSEKTIGADFFAGLNPPNFIFLGPTLPGRTDDSGLKNYQRVYGSDMIILIKSEDILARTRAFAKKSSVTAKLHDIYLPELSSSDHYFFNCYLTVPVERLLEKTAKRLIAVLEDFISAKTNAALVPQWRCDLRAEGVNALQYFKSAKNAKLLKSLLDAPDCWMIKDWSNQYRDMNVTNKIYSVRNKAYEVLKGWGVDVPKPVAAETISTKATKP